MLSMPIYPLQRVFYPQNRPCTPKIVGTFYMQGYKVKEKTAIVPSVSKLSGHPDAKQRSSKSNFIIFRFTPVEIFTLD
jgi:hypothetical protein